MEIRNETPFAHALALGLGPDRSPHVGVILKGTFVLPEPNDAPLEPASEQADVLTADEYFDGDAEGSVLFEAENYVFKPRADIVVIGTAVAPGGRAQRELNVALRVGNREWALRVIGDRKWLFPSRAVLVPLMSEPEPFVELPLRYEYAFGGFDHLGRAWCAENPIGRGFIGRKTRESVHESSLPNIEDPRALIRSWDDQPRPLGWGFIRKDWVPRAALAGQQPDELDPAFGLPDDFDHAFFNGAHTDLQVPFLAGDEVIEFQHLTRNGYRRFRLPGLAPQVELARYTDGRTWDEIGEDEGEIAERPQRSEELPMRLDTLVLSVDAGLLYLVWRANAPVSTPALDELAGLRIIAPAAAERTAGASTRPYAQRA